MVRGSTSTPLSELDRGEPKCVYVIDGDERFLVNEAVDRIKKFVFSQGARDFNYDEFGPKTPLVRILESAKTLPAFAPCRLVLVYNADKLDFGDGKAMAEYLKTPSPTSVLVFIGAKFDGRTKLYQAFKKSGAAVRFDKPKPKEMPEKVRARAKALGLNVEPAALHLLVEFVGTDFGRACQSLELLSLYVGDKTKITTSDVEKAVQVTRQESIFDLVDAIGAKKYGVTLTYLYNLLSVSREPPLRVLFMIARHFRLLLKTRAALDQGKPQGQLASILQLPPFLVSSLVRQAKTHTQSSLARSLSEITLADRALKGGALKPKHALERLVINLMQNAA